MIKLKKILSETQYEATGRSKELTADQLKELLTGIDINKYNNHNIYRGNSLLDVDSSYIVKPSLYNRQSRNTSNEYTLLFDNLPSWSEYPKRSKSIVCSTSYQDVFMYSDNYDAHIVIPIVDRTGIGICPSVDMWISFNKEFAKYDLTILNNILESISNKFINRVENRTWNDMIELFEYMNQNRESVSDYIQDKYEDIESDVGCMREYIRTNNSIIDILNNRLSPEKNGFSLIKKYDSEYNKINNNSNVKHEVWTDNDCILLSRKDYSKLVKNEYF